MKFSNRKLLLAVAVTFSILLSLSTSLAANKKMKALETLGADAYVWGYPAVFMKHARDAMLNTAKEPASGVNEFFATTPAQEKFLKTLLPMNSENKYHWAWVDLSKEPLLFYQSSSPSYFSVQFVDAYTNVFQVVSNETLHGKATTFALTSPTWKGDLPAGVVRIKATTPEIFVLAQSSAQKAEPDLTLVPLSNWKAPKRGLASRESSHEFLPEPAQSIKKNLAPLGVQFLNELFAITQKNPPPTGADLKQLETFTKALPSKPNAEEKAAIERGLFAGARKIEDRIATGFGPKVNGWSYELKAEPFREDYLARAAVAQESLFSTPSKELVHLKATADNEDRKLYGDFAYVMHFEKGELPPTPTGWTLRVFEATGREETATMPELARLNNKQAKLFFNEDGSMDIHLQAEPPESKEELANWLPLTKEASFSVVLTIYNPTSAVLTRRFVAPAIARVESEGLKRPKIVRTMTAHYRVSHSETLR